MSWLNVKGEDTFYGDIGKVDSIPDLSGSRSYNFQVGKGNSATTSATDGAAEDPLAAVMKYLPTLILVVAAAFAALFVFGGRKK